MAIYLNHAETERLAREVADLTGETITEAVRVSLAARLRHEMLRRGRKRADRTALDALVERFRILPVLDSRTPDEIIDYDENGLPS
jgi:antitoxin VapB